MSKRKQEEDFEITFASETEDGTVVLTSVERASKWLSEAMDRFDPKNRHYSAYLLDDTSDETATPDILSTLAKSPQTNLSYIKRINNLARKAINKDDLIGITVDSIENNVNTKYKVSYDEPDENKSDKNDVEVRKLIKNFNKQINLKRLIRRSIPVTYAEGNYYMYLRNNKGSYVVDFYPLGVAEISDYEVNGDPVLLINMTELEKRLKKTMLKTKKGRFLFFDSVKKEIQRNYPPEVFAAYRAKEKYAVLDIERTGVLRIGNLNRKYGLTPIFRALNSMVMLETFEAADRVNTKAKSKKIIFQKLRKELLGQDGDRQAFAEMAYAHENLMSAWMMPTVVVTPPAYVEDIKYVEPTTELTNVENISQYRSRVMTCLGIGFLSQEGKETVSTADISVKQLMKTINKISEQLEDVLNKWYGVILKDSGYDVELAPTIKIIDSEQMTFEVRQSLADFLYSKLGASYNTVCETIGINVEDERQRREKENEAGFDQIFTPHLSSFTANEDTVDNGRPPDENSKDPDKQNYDKKKRSKE